jgi:hypothetical protein
MAIALQAVVRHAIDEVAHESFGWVGVHAARA